MPKPLKTILCWILICSGCAAPVLDKGMLPPDRLSKSFSVELQLLDVHLGTPYAKVKAQLTQKHGAPVSQIAPTIADTFKLDPKTGNTLKIFAKLGNPSTIEAIVLHGTRPIEGLNFFSNFNLGEPEENIPLKFPKATLKTREEGIHQYDVPFSNYFFDAKDGKVITLGIWDSFTFPVKAEDDAISLSYNLALIANLKGLLTEEGVLAKPADMVKLKSLTDDRLRPYCKERHPLRQALNGKAYVDVNFYKNEKETPTPATFSLDTGWVITSISPELCRKVNCESSEFPEFKLRFAGGMIQLGAIRDTGGMLTIMAPGDLRATGKIDGVLGNSSLFEKPVFINFKQGYLCTPTLPVSEVARKLKFSTVSSDQRMRGLFTDFYANSQRLRYGRLDSGASTTTLTKKDIAHLKLKDLQKTGDYFTVSGPFRRSLYGPVEIGWPSLGITQNLKEIAESRLEFPLIGIDFLRHYILSTDFRTGNVYIGE